jgi:hypothetical protein
VGGLGIIHLDEQNKCLLSKWLFKLFNENGLWQDILRKKYLKNQTLTQVQKKSGDSQFWQGLMDVKEQFLSRGRLVVHDGSQTRLWEDLWIGSERLMDKFSSLYNIVRKRGATVTDVSSSIPLKISFRHALVGDKLVKWRELVSGVLHVELGGG